MNVEMKRNVEQIIDARLTSKMEGKWPDERVLNIVLQQLEILPKNLRVNIEQLLPNDVYVALEVGEPIYIGKCIARFVSKDMLPLVELPSTNSSKCYLTQ